MSVLHDVSTQDSSHTLARSIGFVGLAREGSGGHDDSTRPVSRPLLNPSEKPPFDFWNPEKKVGRADDTVTLNK